MQQARDLRAEEAVEAVRNREDGTRPERGSSDPKGEGGNVFVREWTHGVMSTEGISGAQRAWTEPRRGGGEGRRLTGRRRTPPGPWESSEGEAKVRRA